MRRLNGEISPNQLALKPAGWTNQAWWTVYIPSVITNVYDVSGDSWVSLKTYTGAICGITRPNVSSSQGQVIVRWDDTHIGRLSDTNGTFGAFFHSGWCGSFGPGISAEEVGIGYGSLYYRETGSPPPSIDESLNNYANAQSNVRLAEDYRINVLRWKYEL